MTVFLSLMGEQKVSRQFKQYHRTTFWAKSKLISRLSSMFLPQLGKNIKFGQSPPPTALPMKRTSSPSPEASLEDDLFLSSPMEIVTHQDLVLSDSENKSSDTPTSLSPLNLPGTGSEMEEKVTPVKSSRPKRHFSSAGTIESVNLDAIPLAIARLDNSAAKHKLSVKPKNQRVSKKHRRLGKDQLNDQESFESQLSLDQNGHTEEKQTWPQEQPRPLDSEEEKRQQEEYWRHLEAEYRRQKAEKKRLEEQRLQEVEKKLWEETKKPLLEEEEKEAEEEKGKVKQQHLEGQSPRQELEEENGQKEAKQKELKEEKCLEAEEQLCWQEEEAKQPEELKRQEELEEQRKQETEKHRQEEERKLLEELKRREEGEEQRKAEAKKQRLEDEEQKLLEDEKQRLEEEEEQKLLEAKKQRLEEEEQKLLEAEKQRLEEEEQKLLETEKQRREEVNLQKLKGQDLEIEESGQQVKKQLQLGKKDEGQKQRWKEEGKLSEALQEQGSLEFQKHPQDWEAQRQPESGEERHLESQAQNLEEQRSPKHEGPGGRLRGLLLAEKQSHQAVEVRERQQRGEDGHGGAPLLQEEREAAYPQKEMGRPEKELAQVEKKEMVPLQKDQMGEELRWQEVEERQSMPRPYTFQVSSGGKQILFPKVNLSPVTLGKESGLPAVSQEPKANKSSKASHPLPSSLSIPHTAILVTGAQLCGPAVNLNQIKDPACKTLLGLSEEKKHMDIPALENTPRGAPDSRAASGKAKFPKESSSSKAALAEWESIRSRILKNTDSGQVIEKDLLRHSGESMPRGRCDSRGNLKKTLSTNAKFSIMPAWQKFSDGGTEGQKQNAENHRNKAGLGPSGERAEVQPPASGDNGHQKIPEKTGMQQEPTDTAEGCKFAKDLPSFLVPSSPLAPQKALAQPDLAASSESETGIGGKAEDALPSGEESTSPFGIKLRRTNYSLRYHYDQQVEQSKKKKRHSTGDNFDGVASILKNKDGDKNITSPTQEKQNDSLDLKDSLASLGHQPAPLLPSHHIPSSLDHDKPGAKSPLPQKPALAPKPTSQTPPSSPLSKMGRPFLVELLSKQAVKPDQEPSKKLNESEDSGDLPLLPVPHTEKRKEEEETTEKKSSSSQKEKADKTPEMGKKEKPVLQSWHSLEGSKSMEKPDTAQPQWITLALQKQKGFREQQATREERKQAREAKQAERLSKENAAGSQQPESSNISRIGSFHKPTAQEDEKKIETAVSRLERREQLKKSNTLPTSVTVEISDSAMPASLMKEVPKRFSTPDAAPVSTEPAWLALAKRKAKAWSDCPQIIK
ncbi:capping protein-inhibiting regulator of actin dynamics isoform X2 [Monodelphis domestica]|uniref:capping protein-inhibiting regulator of actin dynamics isoform X2 n=1 Tax=Monodelphis domestica TaxID=13616 RepID=UPI0024E24D36|nr:capping protein-inhibiting regulator of actin dynamics isoform X2 [Monodelphis domestica]XP_056658625.1 capping protein-inhibiting regulator of actin dynamics isoform X2 [Monodelphis domestica]XP_056658626.1 capping protein-inhibiting regulator of actin dynamics isoform X2 [Monodelphis domestica]XP_056658628.1 capping protein-inhibiting regulator of actin dynamics isoform X2 [Monodelphis domestica]XP_056658629.1 capping protein-inhibiting regulator of actin dynamics isoform X2 [Monodelphis d